MPPKLHFEHMQHMYLNRRLRKPQKLALRSKDFVAKLVSKKDAEQPKQSLNRHSRNGKLQESAYHFELYVYLQLAVPKLLLS